MCKYSYISGACANRRIESIHCIGEDDCEYSDMNVLGPSIDTGADVDPMAEEWHRLYCDAHNRFFCDKLEDCPRPSNPRIPGSSHRQQKLVDDGRGIW